MLAAAYHRLFSGVNEAGPGLFASCLVALTIATSPALGDPGTPLSVPALDGSVLTAYLYRPADVPTERLLTGVVILPREVGDPARWNCVGEGLSSRGVAVLVTGVRTGWARRSLAGGAGEVFGERRQDGAQAAAFLRDSLALPWDRIWIAGEGQAAVLAAWSAARSTASAAGFLLFDPVLTQGDLDIVPLLKGLDRPTLIVASDESAMNLDAARNLYLALSPRASLWQEGGALRRLLLLLEEPEQCDGFAGDLRLWMTGDEARR